MPLFEYTCRKCGETFEKLVSGGREVSCPDCGSADVEKKLSAFAVTKTDEAGMPACGSAGCGFDRGGCGSGFCGHTH